MTDKLDEVAAHKHIAEEAWHRGMHMRDTEVTELRAEIEKLERDRDTLLRLIYWLKITLDSYGPQAASG